MYRGRCGSLATRHSALAADVGLGWRAVPLPTLRAWRGRGRSMKRRPTNLTLPPRTVAALRATGNASRYVEALVAQHARRWRVSLAFLERRGWSRREIRAAVAHGNFATHAADRR